MAATRKAATMNPIRSFVIRIYRRDRHGIAGLVEDVRTGHSTPFSSLATLWAALTARPRKRREDAAPPTTEETP